MSQEIFDHKYRSLNKAQKEAVDTIYGPLMVVAGPGTGKTTLLTLRIANILKQTDTSPEQILALTFTESGAKAMKDKLREIIGSDALKVNIFTYHSFAEQILRRYNDHFAEFNNFRFISEDDAISLFEEIIDKGDFKNIKPFLSPFFQVKNIIGYIKELKREFIDPESLKKHIDTYEQGLLSDPENFSTRGKTKGEIKSTARSKFNMIDKMKELREVFEEYESQKLKRKFYDFEDIINEVVKKVSQNADLQYEIAEQYQFVLADEHQDANMSQNRILDFFGSVVDSPNIMVVGDEKQAIFRFQGGTLENFTGFKDRYPSAKLVTLIDNFRSHQNILDYSFGLISKRSDLLINKENLLAKGLYVGEGKITFATLSDRESECEYVGESIKKILSETQGDTVAVIFRKNKDKERIARVLETLGVDYISHSDNELFEDRYALEIVNMIKVCCDLSLNQNIVKLLASSIFNITIEKIHKINKDIYESGQSAFDVISQSKDLEIQHIVQHIRHLASYALKNSPVLFVEEFARTTDYLKTSDSSVLEHKLSILRAFANIARQVVFKEEDANIHSLNNFIEKAILYDMKISIPKDSDNSRVVLMTAHKSKGLEFDNVFIIHMTHNEWDKSGGKNYFIPVMDLLGLSQDVEDMEDTRKLLYVAMTRAKKSLTLTFPKYGIDGKEESLSGFVDEIDTTLLTPIVIDKKSSLHFLQDSVSKEKIQFYKDLFLSQSFSVTAFNNYLDCPNKFLFNNLLRFPFSLNISLEVGNAVHESLEEYHNLILRKKEHTKEILFALFEKNLDKKSIREKEKQKIKKDYKQSIFDFVERGDLGDTTLLKAEFRLEYDYEFEYQNQKHNIFIKGSVDRVDRIGEEYRVIDFKTGKPKSENVVRGLTQDSDGNYLRQIIFYKMIMEMMDKNMNVSTGEINFILNDDKGERVFYDFALTSDMVSNLQKEMNGVLCEIVSGEFLIKGCYKEDCEFCSLRKSLNVI